jgi:hypothetical protein
VTGLPTNTICNIIDNSGTGWFCRTDGGACYTYCLPGSGLKVQEQFMFYRTATSSTTPISAGTSMVIKSTMTNKFCRVGAPVGDVSSCLRGFSGSGMLSVLL